MSETARQNSRTVIVLLVVSAAVAAGHLLPGLDRNEIQIGIRNALHVIVFAVFALYVFGRLERIGAMAAAATTLLLVGAVAGIAELVQKLGGGLLDVTDIIRDLLGGALAVGARALWTKSADLSTGPCMAFRVGAAVTGAAVAAPFLFWLLVIALNRYTMPVLVSFDRWWEPYAYDWINAGGQDGDGEYEGERADGMSAVWQLHRRQRSGISIRPMQADWSGYSEVAFVAAVLEGADTSLTVRINDGPMYGRYSREFFEEVLVTSTPAVYRLRLDELVTAPGRAPMDITDISQLVLLAPRSRTTTVMLVDDVRLE